MLHTTYKRNIESDCSLKRPKPTPSCTSGLSFTTLCFFRACWRDRLAWRLRPPPPTSPVSLPSCEPRAQPPTPICTTVSSPRACLTSSAEVLDSLAVALRATQQHAVLASGALQRQLIEGQRLAASLQSGVMQ
jgi:hypothetical protein